MLKIIITIILVSAFFILFFKPQFDLENKREDRMKASTIDGFIEDTYRDPFIDRFVPPKRGNIGTFGSYSSVPEDHWLHGFPHEKA